MTAITRLREEIARHPSGSNVARLLSWAELTIADQFDVIDELQQELQEANAREDKARRMLSDAIDTIARHVAGNPIALYRRMTRDDWFRLAKACSMRPPKNADAGRILERIEALGIEARAKGFAAFLADPKTHVIEQVVTEIQQELAA